MEKFLELDPAQLNQLRDEFLEFDGLTVEQFVAAMLRLHPPGSKQEELQLVHQLADLFAQVDINGDGTMEFDEFTLFFISAGNFLKAA
jgi:Ca2+-binding EF-hand superfamily protein